MNSKFKVLWIGFFALFLPMSVWATESSSSNYILWADGQTSGGNRAASTNYIIYESAGDTSGQAMDSSNYHAPAGFQAVYEEPKLTMALSSTSVSLSPQPITTGAISSGNMSVTVSTNADFGYNLTLTETSEFQNVSANVLDDVTDGTVTAGSEEFGVSVTGTDAAFGDDQAPTSSPLTLATNTIWGADRTTTVTFEAAVSGATQSGQYSGQYTMIASGNF